jgi:lysozyme family protein
MLVSFVTETWEVVLRTVSFSPTLREQYQSLFNTCAIRPGRAEAVEQMITRIRANRSRYQSVGDALAIPWFFVAVIHDMEASGNFNRHLHNGDPLTARTVQVPAGRPKTGTPPFTWEESASDALSMKKLGTQTDWSLAGVLYQLERYNGWGYRLYHPHVLSPYLWGFSNHYVSGKYVHDGTWSDSAVSKQCGAAVLLRRLAERGEIEFMDQPSPDPYAALLVSRHSKRKPSDPAMLLRAEQLQMWLNTFPGIFVKVDGVAGDRTSEAYKKVTGAYLPGDARARTIRVRAKRIRKRRQIRPSSR